MNLSLLLLLELTLVELELITLQDVAVSATALAGAGSQAGQQATGGELLLDVGVELSLGETVLELGFHVAGSLLLVLLLLGGLGALLLLLAGFSAELLEAVGLEGGGIDLDNGALNEGLGTDQFVVGGIVDDIQDSHLTGGGLGGPGKVTGVQTEGAVLLVATHGADRADTTVTVGQLGHGSLTSELELALLLMDVAAAARLAVLVAGVAGDPHGCCAGCL